MAVKRFTSAVREFRADRGDQPAKFRRSRVWASTPIGTPSRASAYNCILMKARVYVSLKTTVLDPQGQAVRAALRGLGHAAIADVRQGKFFDIAIADGMSREQAQKDVESIAHEVLANPVIEEYKVEILA
jgi:phosphoribosylformylglycinamidine synthase PurS subunit